jgi:hypothetical protein
MKIYLLTKRWGAIQIVKRKLPGAKFLIFLMEQQHYVSCSRKYIRLVKCNKLQSKKKNYSKNASRKRENFALTLAIKIVKCIEAVQTNTYFFQFKDLK